MFKSTYKGIDDKEHQYEEKLTHHKFERSLYVCKNQRKLERRPLELIPQARSY